jgi:crossover junction endodeoxyribonuclease RusA
MSSERIVIHTEHCPPSVNECFANVAGKGRVRTKRYAQWAKAAGWDFNGKGTILGAFSCIITIDHSRRHVLSDIDNRIKPTLDLLQTHGIVTNDNLCEEVTARWGDAKGGMTVEVRSFLPQET